MKKMQVPWAELRTVKTQLWCMVIVVIVTAVADVASLNGPNVCMVKQKYNITKRVKYRAPMSVRTYEWCFAMPPRCSRWNTEMRDLTRLETEERTAEVAVCCPGYKMKDVSCVPICPYGKTGPGCSNDCPDNKWGPNCVLNCTKCADHGSCSPLTGECECEDGWQGESCEIRMTTTQASTTLMEELLTTTKSTTITLPSTSLPTEMTSKRTSLNNASTISSTTVELTTMTTPLTSRPNSDFISTTITPPISTTSPTPVQVTTEKLLTTAKSLLSSMSYDENTMTLKNATQEETVKTTEMISTYKPTSIYDNITITPTTGTILQSTVEEIKIRNQTASKSIYNRTEAAEIISTTPYVDSTLSTSMNFMFTTDTTPKTKLVSAVGNKPESNSTQIAITTKGKEVTAKPETTRRTETTLKTPTTPKFKAKEIWIKPTQKGESNNFDYKIKSNYELTHLRARGATKKEIVSEYTTPRTIIVSIIPTSVSYAIFKKIALTTSSYITTRNGSTKVNKTEHGLTSSMAPHTSLPPFIKKIISGTISANISSHLTSAPITSKNVMKVETKPNKKEILSTITTPVTRITNSMSSMEANSSRLNPSHFLTAVSTSTNSTTAVQRSANSTLLTKKPTAKPFQRNSLEVTTKSLATSTHNNRKTNSLNVTKIVTALNTTEVTTNASTKSNNTEISNIRDTNMVTSTKHYTTEEPLEDETFHILTEPEHITAVMSDKERDRSSMDLISVVSIAGGVMMAVITVAVLIVMVERCRRPRYEDVRKVNDIRMQVMIDSNEAPPPYSRSIFHTPLPEPPPSDKCHYQPISTLDRNLKQFMRPVVVQNISPIMLENFRGILECHYDHLPRRNHDFGTLPTRFTPAPSMSYAQEIRCQKSRSVTDSAIEALKCEAKFDVIDSTTSEPLYAEIPCWRPPSEHAIEVLNLNGEAITEL